MKVQGVDQAVLGQIQQQTQKQAVQETKQIRIDQRENKGHGGREQGYQEKLEFSARQVNEAMQTFNIKLMFQVDRENDEMYVLVVDLNEGKVIRRVPPDDVLKMAAQMQYMVGMLVNELV